jgi:hypothetical protein
MWFALFFGVDAIGWNREATMSQALASRQRPGSGRRKRTARPKAKPKSRQEPIAPLADPVASAEAAGLHYVTEVAPHSSVKHPKR